MKNTGLSLKLSTILFFPCGENLQRAVRYSRAIKFAASKPDRNKSPVLLLDGNYAGISLDFTDNSSLEFYVEILKIVALSRGRDSYLISPRGLGILQPQFNCNEILTEDKERTYVNIYFSNLKESHYDAIDKCKSYLVSRGHNLSAYNSFAIAQDIEKFRENLGIKQWSIFGLRYASKIALLLAKHYPDTVESMVLDGVTFPDVSYLELLSTHQEYILNRHVTLCRYSTCKYLSPTFENKFWELVDRYNSKPLLLNLYSHFEGRIIDYWLTGDELIDIGLAATRRPNKEFDFPRLIHALDDMGVAENVIYVQDQLINIMGPNYGVVISRASAYSHLCYEEIPITKQEYIIVSLKMVNKVFRNYYENKIKNLNRICDIWGIESANPSDYSLSEITVPVLFFQGRLDPDLPHKILEERLNNDNFIERKQILPDPFIPTYLSLYGAEYGYLHYVGNFFECQNYTGLAGC